MKTDDAITFYGGRDKLAKALGIDRSATYHWGDTVPIGRQFQLQILTKGKLIAQKTIAKQAGPRQ